MATVNDQSSYLVSDRFQSIFTPENGFLRKPQKVAEGIYFLGAGPKPGDPIWKAPTNVNAADTTNADQLRLGGGLGLDLDGSGVIVYIWDGGRVRSSHVEFNNGSGSRVTFGTDTSAFDDHATHVAGTIAAEGDNANARGMANQANLVSYDFDNDLPEMTAAAANVLLSNHSYSFITGWDVFTDSLGPGTGNFDWWIADRSQYANNAPPASMEAQGFGKYQEASNLDALLYSNPNFLSIWAASNDRNDAFQNLQGNNGYVTYFSSDPGLVGWSGDGYYFVTGFTIPDQDGNNGTGFDTLPDNGQTAKNTLVVGAVNDITVDPIASGDVVMTSFSSWGPTDDGRVKPDVVGNGSALFSSIATNDSSYASYSGTSMAAPNVTGTVALLLEHFRNLTGNPNAAVPSATMKGLLIHTATDAGNVGPDYSFGWGLVDGARAANFLTDALNPAPAFNQLVQNTYSGTEIPLTVISDGTQPLKATLVWTDPAGTPHSDNLDDTTPVLVNDLDLQITGPEGTPGSTTFNPWTLDPANPGNAAVRTTRNSVDNVEQVLIDTPVAGTYTIRVNHTGADFTQNYALLISGTAAESDLQITKTDGQDTVVAGDITTYTIVATNAGPDNVTDATIADAFPAELSSFSWTAVGSSGTDGFDTSGTTDINDTGITIPSGGSITYTVTATIDPGATGTIDNVVTLASSLTDTDTANNAATDSNTVLIQPDLSITKDDATTSVVAGTPTTYTIIASNAGLSDAEGAVISDTFPASLGTPSWTSTAGGGATGNDLTGSGPINDTVTMPVGSAITYTVIATVDGAATDPITNIATITAPAGATDPNTADNIATDINTLTTEADLSITKDDGQTSVIAGDVTTYTIVASNAGPSSVTNATVSDTFPSEISSVEWTAVGSTGTGGFDATGSGPLNDIGITIPSGGSITYTVTANVDSAATGTLTNIVNIAGPAGLDTVSGNNSATDSNGIDIVADLSITKTDGVISVVQGSALAYTVVATNNGLSDALNSTITDNLPAPLTNVIWNATASPGVTGFEASGTGNLNDTGVNLPAGSSVTYIISGTIAPDTAPGTLLSNTATISAGTTVTDPNLTNNSATDNNTTVVAAAPPLPGTPPPSTPVPPPLPLPGFPGFPPPFVPPALTPTIEPPPSNPLPPIYLSTITSNNFRGTEKPETIYGGPFDDTIDGAGGNDTIYAQSGNDSIIGGNGSDKLFGNQGDDRLYGGDGDDTIYGGKDNDFINGERGHDRLRGDLGNDTVRGGDGDDTIYGGKGNDVLLGDRGDDYLSGDLGDDTLDGIGRDRESIGEIDTLVGGEGANLFVLGTPNTVYYNNIGPGAGYGDYALIEDFNASQDRLQLKGGVPYLLNFSPNGLPGGTGIYIDDGSTPGTWDEEDELIAVLKDIAPNDSLFSRMNFV